MSARGVQLWPNSVQLWPHRVQCGPIASSCGPKLRPHRVQLWPHRVQPSALALSSRRISRIFVTVCTCACSSISITPSSSSSSSRAGRAFGSNRAGDAPGLAVGPSRPATGLPARRAQLARARASSTGGQSSEPPRGLRRAWTAEARVPGLGAGVPGLAASSSTSVLVDDRDVPSRRRRVARSAGSVAVSPAFDRPKLLHGLPPHPSLVLAGGGVLGSSYDGGADGFAAVAVGDRSTLISRTSSSDGLPGDLDTASVEAELVSPHYAPRSAGRYRVVPRGRHREGRRRRWVSYAERYGFSRYGRRVNLRGSDDGTGE